MREPLQILAFVSPLQAGNGFLWGIHYWQVAKSRDNFLNTAYLETGFAAMGWGICAAIGLSFADNSTPLLCFAGDGSMLMNGNEVTVAAEHQRNIVFVVLNDAEFGMAKHGQLMNGSARVAVDLPKINFAEFAEVLGLRAIKVSNVNELSKLSTGEVFGGGPTIVEVLVDKHTVPPMGARSSMLSKKIEAEAHSHV